MSKSVASENKWDSVRRYKLTRMINELSGISGHGTELVTVYIPPRRPIYDVIAQLRTEAGTASNIKSDLTRTHVQDALSRTVEQLKLFKETPENGLIIFCGALPTGKGIGTEKIEIFPVMPPKPVQIQLYRCDDHFWTDHLKDMLKDDKAMGLLTIDTQVGGPGATKDTFLREEYLDYRLQGNVVAVLDTSYSGEEGVRELVDKVNEEGVMDGYRLMEEKKIVKRFMKEVYSDKMLGIYGISDVIKSLRNGIVDLVIVTDDITVTVVETRCRNCANRDIEIVERPRLLTARQELLSSSCKNCGNPDQEIKERDIVEYLEELASSTGAGLEIISGKSEEGAQVSSLGQVGAILRFRPSAD